MVFILFWDLTVLVHSGEPADIHTSNQEPSSVINSGSCSKGLLPVLSTICQIEDQLFWYVNVLVKTLSGFWKYDFSENTTMAFMLGCAAVCWAHYAVIFFPVRSKHCGCKKKIGKSPVSLWNSNNLHFNRNQEFVLFILATQAWVASPAWVNICSETLELNHHTALKTCRLSVATSPTITLNVPVRISTSTFLQSIKDSITTVDLVLKCFHTYILFFSILSLYWYFCVILEMWC